MPKVIPNELKTRISSIKWLVFDFFWTLYRITPTPVALAQRFLKELNAPLPENPIDIVRNFAVADGHLYQSPNNKPISASMIKNAQDVTDSTIKTFFTTPVWKTIEKRIISKFPFHVLDSQPDLIQQLFVKWHLYWKKPDRQARIIPETKIVLPKLAERGYKIVIASNSPWDLLTYLKRDGLLSIVENVITFKHTGYQKPHINFFKAMIQQIPDSTTSISFIGDTINNDVLPAKSVGLLPILVWNPQQHRDPFPDIPSTIIISSLRELPDIFL